jgi:hypothetical protein
MRPGEGSRGRARPDDGGELILTSAQVQIEPVRHGGFDQTDAAFNRLGFGTVGRLRQPPEAGRNAPIIDGLMKASLIGTDGVQRSGIELGNLAPEASVEAPINGRRQPQFAGMRAVNFQGFLQARPRSLLRLFTE